MKYVLLLAAVLCVVAAALLVQRPIPPVPLLPPQTASSTVTVGTTSISVEVADDPAERMQGLSGRSALPEGDGMLFIFEYENNWGIWMKDMRFPIDIVWAGSDGEILTIAHKVSPQTYPNAFYPSSPTARYVLELPAGYAKAHGIAEGMRLVVQ